MGLGQVAGGYNPCGMGYDFLNSQCVQDSNCDFSGGGGIGYCPPGYQTFAIGTADNPASQAEYQAALVAALAQSRSVNSSPASSTALVPLAPAAPSSGSASWFEQNQTLILVALAIAAALWLFSGSSE